MIAIYSEIDSSRLNYALKALFSPVDVSFFIVRKKSQFEEFKGAKLIYSKETWDNHLHIPPSGFFENDSIIKSEGFDFPFAVPVNGAFHFNFDVIVHSNCLFSYPLSELFLRLGEDVGEFLNRNQKSIFVTTKPSCTKLFWQ